MSMSKLDIAGLERSALRAWPALHTQYIGGWACRASMGYTKRANSMTPLEPGDDFASLLPAFERFAAAHEIPCMIRISPLAPANTDGVCEKAGYTVLDPTAVMVLSSLQGLPPLSKWAVRHAPRPDTAWQEWFARSSTLDETQARAHKAIIAAIEPRAAFASIVDPDGDAGRVVAGGFGVVDDGKLGLFNILVDEEYRGRGLGKSLILSLLAWGKEQGATGAYLQVMERNAAAIQLYETLGFEVAFRYHCRRAPLADM